MDRGINQEVSKVASAILRQYLNFICKFLSFLLLSTVCFKGNLNQFFYNGKYMSVSPKICSNEQSRELEREVSWNV